MNRPSDDISAHGHLNFNNLIYLYNGLKVMGFYYNIYNIGVDKQENKRHNLLIKELESKSYGILPKIPNLTRYQNRKSL